MSLNLSEVFKNFQKIQDNINDLKNETEKLVFLGKSEDGSIEVKMNGRFDPFLFITLLQTKHFYYLVMTA